MNFNNRNPTKKRKGDDGRADANSNVLDDIKNNKNNGNDGRNDDEHHANGQFMQRSLSHMERMEQMMMRMEDKLGTISSLESRCKELEAKCCSLENTLELTLQSVKDVDRKLDSLHNILGKKHNSLEARLESSIMQSFNDHVDQKFDSMLNNLDERTNSQKDFVDGQIEAIRLETKTYHEYNSMLARNQLWEYSADIPPIDQIMSDTNCDYPTAVNLTAAIQTMKEKTIKMRRGVFISEGNKRKGISLDTYRVRDQNITA